MLSTNHVLAFAATSFVLIAAPGPSVMFTISRAMTVGRKGALLTVVGNAIGEYVQVVAVAFGIGALVERSILAYNVLKLVGAAYVVYLGIQAIRHRHELGVAASARRLPAPTRRLIADGFLVGVANPKTIVFFAAIAPQFIDRGTGQFTAQLLMLGAAFCGIALISDSVWATVAGSARAWFAKSPRRMASVGGVGGVAMIGIGTTLAISGRTE